MARRAGPLAARMVTWRWQNDPPTRAFSISVIAYPAASAEVHVRTFDAVMRGQVETYPSLHVQVLEDRHVGDLERAVRAIGTRNGAILYTRALGYVRGARFFIVTAASTTVGGSTLDALVDSVHVLP